MHPSKIEQCRPCGGGRTRSIEARKLDRQDNDRESRVSPDPCRHRTLAWRKSARGSHLDALCAQVGTECRIWPQRSERNCLMAIETL